MNKLITGGFTGGFPFVLDDIRFLDDSYREGITMPLRAIGGDNFIISGCTYSTPQGSPYLIMDSGYVMLDGEILKVNGGRYSLSDGYFTKSVSYGSLGTKVSKDGTYTGSTYQICTAVTTSTATSLNFRTALTLNDIITNLAPKPASWTTISRFYNGASSVSGVNALKYRNDGYGNIEIRGILIVTDSSSAFKISALNGKIESPFLFPVTYGLPSQSSGLAYIIIDGEGGFACTNSSTFNKNIYLNLKILV